MEQEPKQKKLVVGVTLPPETQARLAELASERDWSVAQTGAYLIRLGLEKLDELKGVQEPKSVQRAA
jgi:hypothetical protein